MKQSQESKSSSRDAESQGSNSAEKIQSLENELSDKEVTSKRFYALYSFNPQRKQGGDKTEEADVDKENHQSLSIIATNLVAAAEIDLRESISAWLAKDPVAPGNGKFISLGLNLDSENVSSSICYNSVVPTPAIDSLGFDHVPADNASEGMELSQDQQRFVVSFISFQDSSLDLFRYEFEDFVKGLVPLLDSELFVTYSSRFFTSENASYGASSDKPTVEADLSQLSTGIQSYLEQWPNSVLGYLARTLQYLGGQVEHLIYAALMNANLQICGTTSEKEEDIKRFFQCCSLSSLVEQLQPDSSSHRSQTGSADSSDLWQIQAPIVSLTFTEEEGGGEGFKINMDPAYSCTFCKNAADKLMSLDPSNATKIRDFLESIKLAFVHNLNKLKRFIKQAELDYYALYRSLSYLKKCGCGELLLQYANMDVSAETLTVLSALQIFIKDMKLSLK